MLLAELCMSYHYTNSMGFAAGDAAFAFNLIIFKKVLIRLAGEAQRYGDLRLFHWH